MSLVGLIITISSFTITLVAGDSEPQETAAPPRVEVNDTDQGRLYTVHAVNHSVHDILNELVKASGRNDLVVEDSGITHDLAGVLIRADLRERTLAEIVEYVAGAAGLEVQLEPERMVVRQTPARDDNDGFRALVERAIRTYRNVLVRRVGSPESPRLYVEMGNLRYQAHDWFQAIQEYDSLIRLFPNHASVPEALLKSALAAEKLDDRDEARVRLQTLARQYEGNPLVVEAYLNLARLYRDQRDDDAERDAIRAALASLADHVHPPRVHIRAATYLIDGGEFGLAEQLLDDLLANDINQNDRQDALFQRARARFEMLDDLRTIVACKQYIDAFPEGDHAPDIYLLLAQAHLRSNTPIPGLLAIDHLVQTYPRPSNPTEIALLRAKLLDRMGARTRAVRILEEIVDGQAPPLQQKEAALTLAQLAFSRADYEKSKYAYVQYRQAGGRSDRALLGIARCWLAQSNPTRAREAARTGLQLCEDEQIAERLKEVVGQASTELGDYATAAAVFASSRGESP